MMRSRSGNKLSRRFVEMRSELSERLDRTEAILRETCVGLRDSKDRLNKIEAKLVQYLTAAALPQTGITC